MSSTATLSTIIVNAYGKSGDGVAPHFKLLVDGQEVGEASTTSTSSKDYSFTTALEEGTAHTVQIVYDNDAVNSAYRDLYVQSITVNGHTLAATDATYSRYDDAATSANQAGQESMWWNGALTFSTPASYYGASTASSAGTATNSTSTATSIVVNAQGTAAGGKNAHFTLLVDGQKVGEGTVDADSKDFTFTTALDATSAHKVQVQYDNDAVVDGTDRNLQVNTITINGHAVEPTDSIVSYDRGALDGKDMIDGQSDMWWNGSLVVDADKSYFATPSASTSASTTAAQNVITVNAAASTAGGEGAHFTVLVDGKEIGEGTATDTAAKDFSFTTSLTQDAAHTVQVKYDNDAIVDGIDRNLYVKSISVDGKSVVATDESVSVHRDDNGTDIGATGNLYWNATLTAKLDAGYFDAAGSSTNDGSVGSTGSSSGNGTSDVSTGSSGGTPSVTVGNVTVSDPGMVESSGSIDGFLHTEGNQIVDESGNNVRLTGVNWFGGEGYNYVPSGLWADSYQNHVDSMKDLGFNVIRLTWSDDLFSSDAVTNGIDYSKNPDLAGLTRLEVYDKIIDYAGSVGMKVILDHHRNDGGAGTNEGGLWYTDNYSEADVIDHWQTLATRYAGNEAVIGADLHNEPSVSATWGDGNQATDWAAAAERIGNAIQSVNKDWLMIVEGTEWSSTLAGVQESPVEFDVPNKLVYSPHAYGQSVYNFSWLQDSNFPDNLPAQYDSMWGYIYKNNIAPILLGEFGGQMTSSAEQTWASSLIKYLNGDWNLDGTSDIASGDQGMSWTYWAWTPESGDVGGLLEDDYKTVDSTKMDIIKAGLASSTTTTVAGTEEAVFTVQLANAVTTTTTIDYATEDGTATAGSDYTAASGSLTFEPGETTKTVTVSIIGDNATEGTENFLLHLTSGNTLIGTATGTIMDHVA
ncbi:endoglucanase [Azospirillum oryzae]|uniref:cellulase n=1 Tax=Azospirillum oryzae TaxID=286727 RepID=A0A1X7HMN2_9PROT|nr:carbohydrate-binding domain-containing protein [Azospirillum oryzae]SMF88442.1 endoglucanase [Azospirillum oryzae]